jgi:hypothetical protein
MYITPSVEPLKAIYYGEKKKKTLHCPEACTSETRGKLWLN